jgi:phosphate transport system permease protein
MAGLPTIVYGIWGLTVLAPLLKGAYEGLHAILGWTPIFACEPAGGLSIATAGILLAVMVTPYMFAIVKETYRLIPMKYREAAWALGATRLEYTAIMVSMIKPAIVAAALLGFGRAASETVAVALVVGNSVAMPTCVIGPGITVSALIANQFPEANLYPLMQSALYTGGLVLLALGLASNALGLYLLSRVRRIA